MGKDRKLRAAKDAQERRDSQIVRYSSPFGSPAYVRRDYAERLLHEDTQRYELFNRLHLLEPAQLDHGPPKIIEIARLLEAIGRVRKASEKP